MKNEVFSSTPKDSMEELKSAEGVFFLGKGSRYWSISEVTLFPWEEPLFLLQFKDSMRLHGVRYFPLGQVSTEETHRTVSTCIQMQYPQIKLPTCTSRRTAENERAAIDKSRIYSLCRSDRSFTIKNLFHSRCGWLKFISWWALFTNSS